VKPTATSTGLGFFGPQKSKSNALGPTYFFKQAARDKILSAILARERAIVLCGDRMTVTIDA